MTTRAVVAAWSQADVGGHDLHQGGGRDVAGEGDDANWRTESVGIDLRSTPRPVPTVAGPSRSITRWYTSVSIPARPRPGPRSGDDDAETGMAGSGLVCRPTVWSAGRFCGDPEGGDHHQVERRSRSRSSPGANGPPTGRIATRRAG